MAARDTEFYLRCITKCRAVPESERSANVRALLESHELIEAALADVPPVAGSGPPPSFDAVSVALARTLRAAVLCNTLIQIPHPVVWTRWLMDLLAPVHVEVPGTGMARVGAPVAPFPPAGHERALPALGALLSGIFAGSKLHEFSPLYHRLLDRCLSVLDTAEEAVDAALAQLAASAGGSGPRLPNAAELRVACLVAIVLVRTSRESEEVSLEEYDTALQRLLQLEPEWPLALFRAAEFELASGRPERCLPLVRRAHQAADEQRDDIRTSLSGFQMVLFTSMWRRLAMAGTALETGHPRPSELEGVLRAANAACERCKHLLPTLWSRTLAGLRTIAARMKGPLRLMVELQCDSLCAPPGRAGAAIEQRVTAALVSADAVSIPAENQLLASGSELLECSGCNKVSPALRKCSACKQAQYCRCAHQPPVTHPLACVAVRTPGTHRACPPIHSPPHPCSRECQKQHWPEHKAACKAAQQRGS